MTLPVALGAGGSFFVLLALVGSIASQHANIPQLKVWARITLGITGAALIGLALSPLVNTASSSSINSPPILAAPSASNQAVPVKSVVPATQSPPIASPSAATGATRQTTCLNLVKALQREADAILTVNGYVDTTGNAPIAIQQPGYDQAKAGEHAVNQIAQDALAAYVASGLNLPTSYDVPTVLNDVASFIGRLPGEIKDKITSDAQEDWGAMQDRPRVLDQVIAPAISLQCSRL